MHRAAPRPARTRQHAPGTPVQHVTARTGPGNTPQVSTKWRAGPDAGGHGLPTEKRTSPDASRQFRQRRGRTGEKSAPVASRHATQRMQPTKTRTGRRANPTAVHNEQHDTTLTHRVTRRSGRQTRVPATPDSPEEHTCTEAHSKAPPDTWPYAPRAAPRNTWPYAPRAAPRQTRRENHKNAPPGNQMRKSDV